MARWIRLRFLDLEVRGSNPRRAMAVVSLGKALYPHYLVPRIGRKAGGPVLRQKHLST